MSFIKFIYQCHFLRVCLFIILLFLGFILKPPYRAYGETKKDSVKVFMASCSVKVTGDEKKTYEVYNFGRPEIRTGKNSSYTVQTDTEFILKKSLFVANRNAPDFFIEREEYGRNYMLPKNPLLVLDEELQLYLYVNVNDFSYLISTNQKLIQEFVTTTDTNYKLYFTDVKYLLDLPGDEENKDNITISNEPSWGKLKINNGIENWVEEGGKTSAMITGPGMTWLKEESDGTYAWYGIENPLKEDGTYVFEKGSRFWVKWINQNNSEWNYYYNQLDEEHKRKVEDNNLWIFLVGVTAPDGTEYTNLGATVPFYVELGQDWDENDINAVFIANDSDEKIYYSFKNLDFPEGNGAFARLELKHFSPYATYDSLTLVEQGEKSNNFEVLSLSNSTNNDSLKSGGYTNYKTGESCNLECTIISMILSLFALTYINKKKLYN